ncbi:hypothetical protein PIROE2DRAFT_3682, partial [Piromyces sp. E2]
QLEPKIPDYINVDELKNALDVNITTDDYKLDDFNIDGFASNKNLSNEVSRLLNEITMVNTNNTKNEDGSFDDSTPVESPTKSVSTGATTMVNVSPTRSNLSPLSPNGKDLFNVNEKRSSNNSIHQQSLAYPKTEMSMNNLIIPNSNLNPDHRANTQSIYIKEPALR